MWLANDLLRAPAQPCCIYGPSDPRQGCRVGGSIFPLNSWDQYDQNNNEKESKTKSKKRKEEKKRKKRRRGDLKLLKPHK